MRSSADGFTMLEMIVAVGIAVLMMSLAMVALTTTTRAQSRSGKLLVEQEEARSALMRIRRDVEGVFEANGNYFEIQGADQDVLVLICATENTGASDYVKVSYYVPQLDTDLNYRCLVREVVLWPFTGAPEAQVVARDVRQVRFESDGATPPEWIKVGITMILEEMSSGEWQKMSYDQRQEYLDRGGQNLIEIRYYEETVSVPAGS